MDDELYAHVERSERDPRFQGRERSREAEKQREDRELAKALTASALRGVFGPKPQKLANEYTLNGSNVTDETCRAVAEVVCKLPPSERRRVRE